ncbi:MAG: thermonuclease family protein [Bacillota bacterium]
MKRNTTLLRLLLALVTGLSLMLSVALASVGTYKGYPVARIAVDGRELTTDVPAIIMDGRTLVPIRVVAEALGVDIRWNAATWTVEITTKPQAVLQSSTQSLPLVEARVTRVVDGDTFYAELPDGSEEKVRLTGVDAPESSGDVDTYGKEASAYTARRLTGATVYLEKDVQDRDKYGRLLAYVWLAKPADAFESEVRAKMFNAELLLEGYAQVMTVPPNVKYADLFVRFQREARNAGKGLWGLPASDANRRDGNRKESELSSTTLGSSHSGSTQEDPIVYVTKSGTRYHRDGCRYLGASKIPIRLSEAKAEGYTPCSVCKPQELTGKPQRS